MYPQELFISEQSAHQGSVKGKLQDVHKQMKALMRSTHEIFKSDSDEVRSRAISRDLARTWIAMDCDGWADGWMATGLRLDCVGLRLIAAEEPKDGS